MTEQLPNDFLSGGDELARDLRGLDEAIARQAAAADADVPAGLEDRVFAASVTLLPAPSRSVAGTIGRGSIRTLPRVQWWGRLAMAASVGVAVVIASTLTTGPMEQGVQAEVTVAAYSEVLEAGPFPEPEDGDLAVAHLLRTASLTSYDEVSGELESLISEFGM